MPRSLGAGRSGTCNLSERAEGLLDGRGAYLVEWGGELDLVRAHDLCTTYRDLDLGLVDAVVMATAERLGADAIATLDFEDFGAVEIRGRPRLLPRDL